MLNSVASSFFPSSVISAQFWVLSSNDSSFMMDAKKEPGPTVQFTDKADGLVAKPCYSKPKMVAAFGAITVVLLLSIVVSLSVYFSLKNTTQRPSLAELNLEEGESLTYQLDHDIEVEGGNVQNGTFH